MIHLLLIALMAQGSPKASPEIPSPMRLGPEGSTSVAAAPKAPKMALGIRHDRLYQSLLVRAKSLRAQSETQAQGAELGYKKTKAYGRFQAEIEQQSKMALLGHDDLKTKGQDRDLKCILKGMSIDLKTKSQAIEAAQTQAELRHGFQDMADLLRDMIEVLTTPATTESGLDCVIEFGTDA